jgi:hypothetical protein
VDGPGKLLASGRDGDIFELGDDGTLVLRRTRDGRSLASEARILEHVHAAAFIRSIAAGSTAARYLRYSSLEPFHAARKAGVPS